MHALGSLHPAALGVALVVSGHGAWPAEVRSTIAVSAIVLPTYIASLTDATVTVHDCGQACVDRGDGGQLPSRDASQGRALSAAERARLLRDGLEGLTAILTSTSTSASGVTIVSLDF